MLASTGVSGKPDLNIVEVELSGYDVLRKDRTYYSTAYVTGRVVNGEAGQMIPFATLTFTDRKSGKVVGQTQTALNGSYKLKLEGDKTFSVTISAKGFKSFKADLVVKLQRSGRSTIAKDFILKQQ